MINKLIDEPYWNELPYMMEQFLGGRLIYIRSSWRERKNWQTILGKTLIQGFLFKTERYLCDYKTIPVIIDNPRKLWSARQVTHWLTKNIHFVRVDLVDSIFEYIEMGFILPDTIKSEIRRQLLKENNLQEIFNIYMNLKFHHENFGDSRKYSINLNDFKSHQEFQPRYVDLIRVGDEYDFPH